MSIEELLYNILTADSALTTQAGGIYWRQAPAGTSLPYITYFQVDDPRTKELLSYYGGEARIQFSIFDESASNALTTSAQLVDKVKELRGKPRFVVGSIFGETLGGGGATGTFDVLIGGGEATGTFGETLGGGPADGNIYTGGDTRIHGRVANILSQPANTDGIYHRTVDVIVRYTEEA